MWILRKPWSTGQRVWDDVTCTLRCIYGFMPTAAFRFFSLGKYIKGPSRRSWRVLAEWFMAVPELGGVFAGLLGRPLGASL